MPSPGDLLLDWMGQSDPRRNLAAAINQGIGMGQPDPSAGGGKATGGLPTMAQGGMGPDQPNPPQQQQPQAYQSPPDIASTLFELQRRQNSAESINRGLGLLFGGFARPEDRAPMLQAMSGLSGGGGVVGGSGSMEDIIKLYGSIQNMQAYRTQLLHAPVYAKQLGLPVEQVIAYIQAGKLPEIIDAVKKNQMALSDPLHQAQTSQALASGASSQSEADTRRALLPTVADKQAAEIAQAQAAAAKAQAETAAIPATVAKTQAETAAIPATVAKTQAETAAIPVTTAKTAAETAAIPATVAKTQAETQAIPGQIAKTAAETAAIPGQVAKTAAETAAIPSTVAKTQADTQLAVQQAAKAQAEALARQKLAALTADPNFTAKFGITPEAAAALPPDELAKLIATPAQVTAQTSAKVSAEDMATAKAGLPAADQKAREAMELADDITSNQGLLGWRTGKAGMLPAIPGSDASTLQAKIDKLQGTTGVAAVESLRGVGRILGAEFSEGEKSQSLLHHQTIPTTAYVQGVKDFKAKLGQQMAIMYQRAGMEIPDYYKEYATPSSPAPTTNTAPSKLWKRNPQSGKLEQQ